MTGRELYLTVRLDQERLGLPVSRVKEIFEPETVTRVPGAARCIRGVINLRGSVVPVVDLGAALGLRDPGTSTPRSVVLLEAEMSGERSLIGLAPDAVEEVVELGPEDVDPAPSFGTAVPVSHLLGVARSGSDFVLLLDVEQALGASLLGATARHAEAPETSEHSEPQH